MLDKKALKYYRMLRIPAIFSRISRYMYLGIYIITLTPYILKYFLNIGDSRGYLYAIFIHTTFVILLPLYIKLLVNYMKLRQCINMSLFLLLPGIFMEIIGAIVGLAGLIYIFIPIIGVLAVRSFTHSRTKSIAIALYVIVVELVFASTVDGNIFNTLFRFTITIIFITISMWFAEKLSYEEGFDIYKIASSWIKTLLLNDEGEFSSIMNSIGLENNVKTHLIIFDLATKRVALVVPEIHYGPFRNIGSASFPYVLEKIFKEQGLDAIVLHSAGSHERNLVSLSETLKYGYDIISKLAASNVLKEDVLNEPFRVYTDFFEAFVIQSSSSSYIVISTPLRGNDDIPYEVQEKASELGKLYGFSDVVVIDAHNLEGPPVDNLHKYEEVLIASLSRSSRQCVDLQVGYGETVVKGLVKGLCNDKVRVLTIKCDTRLYGLIYLYGNNAERGVRDEIRKIALNRGYSDVEVVTADDHSCSGINFDAPYYTIELSTALVKAVEGAIAESLNNVKKCKVYTSVIYSRVKMVGPNIFKLLEIAKDVSRKVLRYLLTSYLVLYLTSLTVLSLINFLRL